MSAVAQFEQGWTLDVVGALKAADLVNFARVPHSVCDAFGLESLVEVCLWMLVCLQVDVSKTKCAYV